MNLESHAAEIAALDVRRECSTCNGTGISFCRYDDKDDSCPSLLCEGGYIPGGTLEFTERLESQPAWVESVRSLSGGVEIVQAWRWMRKVDGFRATTYWTNDTSKIPYLPYKPGDVLTVPHYYPGVSHVKSLDCTEPMQLTVRTVTSPSGNVRNAGEVDNSNPPLCLPLCITANAATVTTAKLSTKSSNWRERDEHFWMELSAGMQRAAGTSRPVSKVGRNVRVT